MRFAASRLKGREHGKESQTDFSTVNPILFATTLPYRISIAGHCVLTAGTDTKTILKIEGVKLLPSHDYAVVGESKEFLIISP
jgi:hypothetical protein